MVATPEGNGRVLKEPSEGMDIFSIFFLGSGKWVCIPVYKSVQL